MRKKTTYQIKRMAMFILLLLIADSAFSAARYWVGSGNWTSSNTANWAATSGGATGQSVPTITDDVYFDLYSYTCSIQTNGDINNFTATGGTISFGGSGTYSFRIRGNYSKTNGSNNVDASAALSFDVDGNFTHNYYAFMAPAGRNMFVGGNWTRTAGAFNHNNGTVIFDGNSATFSSAYDEFFNLTINKNNAQSLTFAAGQDIRAYGSLNFTNGIAASGIIKLYGNAVVGSLWDGGNTKLNFTGAANQSFNLSGAETLFQGDLEILKYSGTLTLGSDLIMNSTNQAITLTAGNLILNGKTLTLYNSTGLTGTINAKGDFTITGSGTINMYNFLQNAAGTFTLSGAVNFHTYNYFKKETASSSYFLSGSAAVDIDGDFIHTAGQFTATSGIMYVGGNWTKTNGVSITHNNGTVIFDGNNASFSTSFDDFFNLTINKNNGQTLTFTPGQNIKTYGTLNFSNGKAASGNILVYGNAVVGSNWDGGNTKLNFNGAANQTFNLSGAETLFQGDLEILKYSGTVTLSSDLIMNSANQAIILNAGNLILNGKTVTLYNSTGLTGTVNATGDFTITGSGTINMYNFLQNAAGIFTLSGAVNFHTYNYFKKTGSLPKFFGGSGTIDIDGDFIQTSGDFTNTSGSMYVGGNWTKTNAFSIKHNNGTIIFDGNNSTFSDNAADFYSITMNKNSGQNLTLTSQSAMYGNGILTLNSGKIITTDWFSLRLGCNITIVMGNSSNNCTSASYVDGPLTRTLCGTAALFYPIGRNGNYRPLTLTTVASTGTNFTVEQIESSIPAWCLPNDLCSVSKVRHFRITITDGYVYHDPITLSYCADDGVTNASDLRIAQQVGTCWKNLGGTGTANGSGTITSTVDFTTYGDFILATKDCLNPLPVELISFKGNYYKGIEYLTWKTASEINNDHFDVERSLDGKIWNKIGEVKGNGNSNSILKYTFEDNEINPTLKHVYYRLMQVDYNGAFEYSPIIVENFIDKSIETKKFAVYPNPANSQIVIENLDFKKLASKYVISDINGSLLMEDSFSETKLIDIKELASGFYFISIYNLNGEVLERTKISVKK